MSECHAVFSISPNLFVVRMNKPVKIPVGSWPRRMGAAMAAGYCGEPSVEAFLLRWRQGEYPAPRVNHGRRKLWLIDDLNLVIAPQGREATRDLAEDL